MFSRQSLHVVFVALFVGLAALLVIVNAFFGFFVLPAIGDNQVFTWIFVNGDQAPTPKYLVGIETLRLVYSSIWKFPPVQSLLGDFATPQIFLSILASLFMATSTLLIVHRWQFQMRIIFPLTSPIWILCSLGYIEYYPFIAGLFVWGLAYLFEKPLAARDARSIGIVCGSLPLIYLGWAPFSAILLLSFATKGREHALRAAGYAALTFVMLLAVFWRGSLASYFDGIYENANFGSKNTPYADYLPYLASQTSVFFAGSYVWSLTHLKEVLGWLFVGGGGAAFMVWLFVVGQLRSPRLTNDSLLLAIGLILWSTFYLLYMVPKYGPYRDVDLFSFVYLIFSFFSGLAVERLGANVRRCCAFVVIAFNLAAFWVLMVILPRMLG